MSRLTPLLLVLLTLIAGPALALEHRSIGEAAILYDSPSEQGRKLFVILRQTPVEVVVTLDKWAKVRDMGGGLAWVERRHLSERRTVQVRGARAGIRQRPDDEAPLAFEALKNVVLEMLEPPVAGWAKVRHHDGLAGYVRVSDVWGL